jgi:pimeloyl-ACP methyl ester carboxylesterase
VTTTQFSIWQEEVIELAGARVQMVRGGSGTPLLVLHDEFGSMPGARAYEVLAARHTLHLPSHPGFDQSERLGWIETVRDLAAWYLRALDELALGPLPVIGLGFGGWLAAEMAAMCPHHFTRLVLVAPPGIKPPEGEIYDMFLVPARTYIEESFHRRGPDTDFASLFPEEPTPEERLRLDTAREETCRLTWRPYMHNPALPHLLERITVPALILWGRQDAVVPLSAGEAYARALRTGRLEVLDECGHHPQLEQPEQFVRLIDEFLAR